MRLPPVHCYLLVTLAVSPTAAAQTPVAPAEPDRAEYTRLTQELESLAERNAWAGAARTYQRLVATGIEPSVQDLRYGAAAAQALGDIASLRSRLMAAQALEEDKAVVETLWTIDKNYAHVQLHCDPDVGWALATETMPFEPEHVRAIEFAVAQVDSQCAFEGYLPAGTYTFCGQTLTSRPGVQSVTMDLRGMAVPRGQRRKARKQAD